MRLNSLTGRQIEVLRYLADDLSNKEIAAKLNLSEKTIDFHRQLIKQKLGVKGVAGMVRYAIRTGLITP
ncbi:MAG TPA: helix-turn-helix transcriptional regulator [Bryobacteraceae bacterium]|nr:helix-turn-helix transcriptional regulator [Bryobacteraceae bacterium]